MPGLIGGLTVSEGEMPNFHWHAVKGVCILSKMIILKWIVNKWLNYSLSILFSGVQKICSLPRYYKKQSWRSFAEFCGGYCGKPELTLVDSLISIQLMRAIGVELDGGTNFKVSQRNRIINRLFCPVEICGNDKLIIRSLKKNRWYFLTYTGGMLISFAAQQIIPTFSSLKQCIFINSQFLRIRNLGAA